MTFKSYVAERVNIEDRARDAVSSDLRLRNVEAHERVGSQRRAELVDGDAAGKMSGRRREQVAPMERPRDRFEGVLGVRELVG